MRIQNIYKQKSADTLHRARLDAGLSLRELASRAGTSHATLKHYESGRKVPSVVNFMKLLECCDVAVDFRLSPRLRGDADYPRGEELVEVLELAEQFPAQLDRHLSYPKFGSPCKPGS